MTQHSQSAKNPAIKDKDSRKGDGRPRQGEGDTSGDPGKTRGPNKPETGSGNTRSGAR